MRPNCVWLEKLPCRIVKDLGCVNSQGSLGLEEPTGLCVDSDGGAPAEEAKAAGEEDRTRDREGKGIHARQQQKG